jgi:hypothetical protein
LERQQTVGITPLSLLQQKNRLEKMKTSAAASQNLFPF